MIKKITLFTALIMAAVISLDGIYNFAYTDSTGTSGYANDPANGNKSCAKTGCHNDFGSTPFQAPSSTIIIKDASNNNATSYVGNATYTITINANNHSSGAGYNCVIENASGTKLGTFTAGSDNRVLNGYSTHKSSSHIGMSRSWTFTWVAPSAGTGNATIYATINRENEDFDVTGDSVFAVTMSLPENTGSGINSIATNSFSINPNPASNLIYLHNTPNFNKAEASVYTLDGKLVMTNNIADVSASINVSDLNKGIYLMQLKTDKGNFTQKFVKE